MSKTLYVVTEPYTYEKSRAPVLRELEATETPKQYRLTNKHALYKELNHNVQFDKERATHLTWDARSAIERFQQAKRKEIEDLDAKLAQARLNLEWANDQLAKAEGK